MKLITYTSPDQNFSINPIYITHFGRIDGHTLQIVVTEDYFSCPVRDADAEIQGIRQFVTSNALLDGEYLIHSNEVKIYDRM